MIEYLKFVSARFLLGCVQFPLWSQDVLDMKEMPYLSFSIQLAFPLSPFARVFLEFLLHCAEKKLKRNNNKTCLIPLSEKTNDVCRDKLERTFEEKLRIKYCTETNNTE